MWVLAVLLLLVGAWCWLAIGGGPVVYPRGRGRWRGGGGCGSTVGGLWFVVVLGFVFYVPARRLRVGVVLWGPAAVGVVPHVLGWGLVSEASFCLWWCHGGCVPGLGFSLHLVRGWSVVLVPAFPG